MGSSLASREEGSFKTEVSVVMAIGFPSTNTLTIVELAELEPTGEIALLADWEVFCVF